MSENTLILYIVVLFVVLSVGLFFLLAWMFSRRSREESRDMAAEEIHITA